SLRQSSHGGGGFPSRDSRYQEVWWRCIRWATEVLLCSSQVTVSPSRAEVSQKAGSKLLPLISQVVLKRPPTVIVQRWSGRWLTFRVQAGSGRSRAGTRLG